MIDDSSRFAWLDDLGKLLIETGLALETTADAWAKLWEIPLLRAVAYIGVPARFNPYSFSTVGFDYHAFSYHQHLSLIEYLSRFDASCLMALPGSSLCTRAILTLGTETQIQHFFERFNSSPHWAFLAVTEPEVGSDASGVRSCLSGQHLNAAKTLIGAVHFASVGLVFARLDGGQQHCFVSVEPPLHPNKVRIERLVTFGLAGAGLCRLEICDLPINPEQILGGGHQGLRHGIYAMLGVFERHRPMVGAMALGTAYGLIEALEGAGAASEALDPYRLEHEALCRRMAEVATRYEQSRFFGHEASLFKLQATAFVERIAHRLPRLLSPERILSSPLIRKRYRDAFAFEYMEGTSNIQRLNAYRTYIASRENNNDAS
jgi:alkylation response protein AidB-like acyl-CoA dehydrogenase